MFLINFIALWHAGDSTAAPINDTADGEDAGLAVAAVPEVPTPIVEAEVTIPIVEDLPANGEAKVREDDVPSELEGEVTVVEAPVVEEEKLTEELEREPAPAPETETVDKPETTVQAEADAAPIVAEPGESLPLPPLLLFY